MLVLPFYIPVHALFPLVKCIMQVSFNRLNLNEAVKIQQNAFKTTRTSQMKKLSCGMSSLMLRQFYTKKKSDMIKNSPRERKFFQRFAWKTWKIFIDKNRLLMENSNFQNVLLHKN